MVLVMARLGPEFDAFVSSSSPDLLRLGRLLTGDRGAAEDLVQVALVRTAAHWRTSRTNPTAYARRAVINLAKNRWRDRSRRPLEVSYEHATDLLDEGDQDHIAERGAISTLLSELPVRDRTVLILRFYFDLPVSEVAATLGCSEGTVKSATSRALATLRRGFEHSPLPTHGAEHV